jgi:hypothetical protein
VNKMSSMFTYADEFDSDLSSWSVGWVTDVSTNFEFDEWSSAISPWNYPLW